MKLFKRFLVFCLLMTLSLIKPVNALQPVISITGINSTENVALSYLKVIKVDSNKKTGWAFVSEDIEKIFKEEYVKLDKKYNDSQKIISELKNHSTHYRVLERLSSLDGFVSFSDERNHRSVVNDAGLYVVKVIDRSNAYTYSPMAAAINFKYACSIGMSNCDLEVKRSKSKLLKEVNDSDLVVKNGQIVTYTLKTNVPYISSLKINKKFNVKDMINGASYLKDSFKIKCGNTPLNLKPTFDNNSFIIDLKSLIDDINSNAGKEVTISYQAIVNSNNDVITNKATVSRNDYENYDFDEVKLYQGKVTLIKTNDYKLEKDKVLLENAGFEVYQNNTKLTFTALGNNEYVLDSKGKVSEVKTGRNGSLVIHGLDLGNYRFHEITAPKGYSINEQDVEAMLTIKNKCKANSVVVAQTTMKDTKVSRLPETGGMGTTIFMIGGTLLMVSAFSLMKRKE